MSETKDLLRRGIGEFEPMPDAFDRVLARRDRKRRNQRVAAGVLGIAVFTLVAIGFIRLLGSERGPVLGSATSPSPTASPSPVTQPPSPFTETFDSPLNGLSIGYPSGWQTRAATEPWGHGEVAFGSPNVDVIFHPTLRNDLYLAVVSEPLRGTSGPEWAAAGSWLGSVGICTDAFGYGGGGGETWAGAAYVWFENCGSHTAGGSVALLATATRGYIIYLHVADDRVLQATYDEGWLKAALETLELRPEGAVDT